MKKIAFLGAVAAAAVAAPAAAHTGPYVGVIAGYDSVSLEAGGVGASEDDVMYGIVAGYDVHYNGGALVGVEVELADSSVGQTYTDALVTGDELSLNAGRDIYAGIRAGFEVTEGTLLYAKGGYTNVLLKGAYDDGTGVVRDNESIEGFRIGAGAEHQFGNLGLRLEYRYSSYGEISFAGTPTGIDAGRHQVVAGFLVKF